jgi:hypothetical protein
MAVRDRRADGASATAIAATLPQSLLAVSRLVHAGHRAVACTGPVRQRARAAPSRVRAPQRARRCAESGTATTRRFVHSRRAPVRELRTLAPTLALGESHQRGGADPRYPVASSAAPDGYGQPSRRRPLPYRLAEHPRAKRLGVAPRAKRKRSRRPHARRVRVRCLCTVARSDERRGEPTSRPLWVNCSNHGRSQAGESGGPLVPILLRRHGGDSHEYTNRRVSGRGRKRYRASLVRDASDDPGRRPGWSGAHPWVSER